MEQLKSGPKEPLMMSGPKFGEGGGWWNWTKKNRSNIILTIIGILIIAGGIYLYSNYRQNNQPNSPATTEQNNSGAVTPGEVNVSQQNQSSQTASSAEKAEIVKVESGKYTVKADKGAGITHLARKALAQYLTNNPDAAKDLKPEQKIYIEDFLRKQIGSYGLKIGQELTFDDNQIKDAIDKSQKLTDKQIQNLHKYVLLVPSLAS